MRTVHVTGACLAGAEAQLVTVEARFHPHDRESTEVVLSGLPDPVIRESRGRVLCALRESRLTLPPGRLILNLVPAGRKKSGEMLDLPLAIAAAAAAGHLERRALAGVLLVGELGIDGALRAVPGGLAAAAAARAGDVGRLVAAPATAEEAAWVDEVEVHACATLAEVAAWLSGVRARGPVRPDEHGDDGAPGPPATSRLAAVRGQAVAVEALGVAAAGRHGLLLVGPPGGGKSLLARALVELLPPLSRSEQLEVTGVRSALGRWPGGLVKERPFRAPHHTTSAAGLVGGGSPPAAGEITLAHGGVLFLDEVPEFRRDVLECLRQPLESQRVVLARAGRRLELPADFQLVAAMNPCPCGYRGHPRTPCPCSEREVRRYGSRLSGPFLDRIDLRVEVATPELGSLLEPNGAGDTTRLVERVRRAHERQAERQTERNGERARAGPARCPARHADELDRLVPVTGELRRLLERASAERELSARAIQSLRSVALTLSDMDGADAVTADHLVQALALRAPLGAGA